MLAMGGAEAPPWPFGSGADWDLVLATALVYTASTKWAAWDAAAKGVMASELNAIGAAGQVGEARGDRALIARGVELHAQRDSPGWGVFSNGFSKRPPPDAI